MGGLHILKIGFGGNYSTYVLDDGAKKGKARQSRDQREEESIPSGELLYEYPLYVCITQGLRMKLLWSLSL